MSWDDEDEEFDDLDQDADDELDAIPCPECGKDVYDDAEHCPYCGHYITPDTSVWSGKPWWWIALGLLGVLALMVLLLVQY